MGGRITIAFDHFNNIIWMDSVKTNGSVRLLLVFWCLVDWLLPAIKSLDPDTGVRVYTKNRPFLMNPGENRP
ncbi:hypothetical protein A3848_20275 [Paenibacillus sp. P32E]|nr:hypothetical protein A3848_20275 [Paenibacillus sp. P32E]